MNAPHGDGGAGFDRPARAVMPPAREGGGAGRVRLDSSELFRGLEELEIVHGDALYRLRITSLGKLILTK